MKTAAERRAADQATFMAMVLSGQAPIPTRPTGVTRAASVIWIIIGLIVLSPCIVVFLFLFLNSVFQALGFYS